MMCSQHESIRIWLCLMNIQTLTLTWTADTIRSGRILPKRFRKGNEIRFFLFFHFYNLKNYFHLKFEFENKIITTIHACLIAFQMHDFFKEKGIICGILSDRMAYTSNIKVTWDIFWGCVLTFSDWILSDGARNSKYHGIKSHW